MRKTFFSAKQNQVKAAAIIGCICLAGVGSSVAYFTTSEHAVNRFTTGSQDVDINESDWDPEDGDGVNIYPGYTVYKNPTVKNTASNENGSEYAYARMVIYIKDDQGKLITDSQALDLIKTTIRYDSTYTGTFSQKGSGTTLQEGQIPGYSLAQLEEIPMVNPYFSQDTARSTENVLVFNYMGSKQDGILNSGEEAALFTDVVIPTDWTQDEIKCVGDFILDVKMEAIQSSGFENLEAALFALDEELENENNPNG